MATNQRNLIEPQDSLNQHLILSQQIVAMTMSRANWMTRTKVIPGKYIRMPQVRVDQLVNFFGLKRESALEDLQKRARKTLVKLSTNQSVTVEGLKRDLGYFAREIINLRGTMVGPKSPTSSYVTRMDLQNEIDKLQKANERQISQGAKQRTEARRVLRRQPSTT